MVTTSFSNQTHIVEVEFRGEIKGGYRLKVSILDLGLYIDGMRLTKPSGTWWLQTPAQRVNGRFWHNTEFNQKMTLWQEIFNKCIEAVEDYESSSESLTEEDLSDEAISKGLDEAIEDLDEIEL
jgi:hypothetical protein